MAFKFIKGINKIMLCMAEEPDAEQGISES